MSVLDSIRNTLVPVHREGLAVYRIFAVVTLVLGCLSDLLFWIGLIS